jgi:hypothetical protein
MEARTKAEQIRAYHYMIGNSITDYLSVLDEQKQRKSDIGPDELREAANVLYRRLESLAYYVKEITPEA